MTTWDAVMGYMCDHNVTMTFKVVKDRSICEVSAGKRHVSAYVNWPDFLEKTLQPMMVKLSKQLEQDNRYA